MTETKLVVMYPYPSDVDQFEKAYVDEHMPIAQKIPNVIKFVATKVSGTPMGSQPTFYRIAELYFESLDSLKEALGSDAGQAAAGHAVAISSGGMPTFLIGEEEMMIL
ncbi:MAG TPA: EthD family reductase [Pyrinomonadaceae bacterium]|jgi:uncharacterized protein (TIGR02118 family)|nr:EthD family reductase [Pyrinomonadaceae bacterium]